MVDSKISPFSGERVCPCGKHTWNEYEMIEHYRNDHPELWKYVRKKSQYEREWLKP